MISGRLKVFATARSRQLGRRMFPAVDAQYQRIEDIVGADALTHVYDVLDTLIARSAPRRRTKKSRAKRPRAGAPPRAPRRGRSRNESLHCRRRRDRRYIGTRLAAAGRSEVSALARGANAGRIARTWLALAAGRNIDTDAGSCDGQRQRSRSAGPGLDRRQGPSLAAVAQAIRPLLGEETVVLPAMNGVPWWFGFGIAGLGDAPLESVDPGGRIAQAIDLRQVVGCVVHMSAAALEPGVVQHKMGQGLIIGEPGGENAGGASERVRRIGDLLGHGGFDVTLSPSIRHDIWYKLWGNMTMNPVSAITGATADRVLDDALVRTFLFGRNDRSGLDRGKNRLRHRADPGRAQRDHAQAWCIQDLDAADV